MYSPSKPASDVWGWFPIALFGLLAALMLPTSVARAHEVRPAYLQIDEVGPGHYQLLWRTPVLSGMRLPVVLRLPPEIHDVTGPAAQELIDSLVERRVIDAGAQGLAGKRIEFVGLQATITDVLVRVQMQDGTRSTTLVRPSRPWVDIATSQGRVAVVGAYLSHGVEHILFGVDHLLFVLGLILIVRSTRMLLLTVTGFTVAHSITLSLATLGVLHVPRPPVEACIALSILLLASEILRLQRGERSLTSSWPWAVAFLFGLLHGLGFASALIDIGLPQGDVPLALLAFNIGVEVGQLAFIAAVLSAILLAKQFRISDFGEGRLRTVTAYGVGTVAAFWFIERLVGFWV
jgi:hydrogenase/urease accessory protein HupE